MAPYVRKLLVQLQHRMPGRIIIHVALFEAEAHMAYLYRAGKIHLVFTKDSDLIVHGVTLVLFMETCKTGTGHGASWKSGCCSRVFHITMANKNVDRQHPTGFYGCPSLA